MDQRAKGGAPLTPKPATPPTPRACSSEEPCRDRAREKKRSREKENGESGKEEEEEEEKEGEERRGAARGGPGGDKGAVLELLIEGRCGGDPGQRPLLFQAKRTKKPPKMLESYVCKPTFRSYQRGRAEAQRAGGGEGEAGQQGAACPAPEEAVREQGSALDGVQPQNKQAASTAPSPPSSSSRSSQRPPLSSTAPSASAPASPGSRTQREVSIKPSGKTEARNANSPPEKPRKDKPAGVSAHSAVTAGHKSCSLKTDQSIPPTALPSPAAPNESAGGPGNQGETHGKHKGSGRTKRPAGGKGLAAEGCGQARSAKVKSGNVSRTSSAETEPAERLPAACGDPRRDPRRLPKNGVDPRGPGADHPAPRSTSSPSPSSPSPSPHSQLYPGSADATQGPPAPAAPPPDKRKEKEKKAKRGNRKEKKNRRERGEVEEGRGEGGGKKKKKKPKDRDRKSRHGGGKEDRGRREGAANAERGKIERKRDKVSPEGHRGKDKRDEPCETENVAKQDRVRKLPVPAEREEAEEGTNKTVKDAQSATAGDDTKSNEQCVPSRQPPASPGRRAPLSPPRAHSPPPAPLMPASTAPQEQDSRPLKKRKARRPSWTKLVHRVQRAENQEAPSDPCSNPYLSAPEKVKTCPSAKSPDRQTDQAHLTPSSSSSSSSTLHTSKSSPHRASCRPSSPTHGDGQRHSPAYPLTPARKRGRPKSHSERLPASSSPRAPAEDAPRPARQGSPAKAPSPETSPSSPPSATTPRKRGRPPKRPLPLEDPYGDPAGPSEGKGRYKGFSAERGIRQLKIRKLISEIKKKRKRLYTGVRSEYSRRRGGARGEAECDGAAAALARRTQDAAVSALSALSPLGDAWGAQINVSKRGTIYMGKRRGRKPKAPAGALGSPLSAQRSPAPPLFTSLSEGSLFASHQLQPPAAHPFPSPSLTHSSGAQSPYSEGSFTDPASSSSSLVFPHPFFSLPSPSSSSCCTSPHPPPASSSLSPFVKKSCPCQGRPHFPFHQSSCKLSSAPAPALHHGPASPGPLKEAAPSPRSESHSEETLPSDSGIGTDNNSVSERGGGGEARGGHGAFRRNGLILGVPRYPSPAALAKRPSPVASHLASVHRHARPAPAAGAAERQRERHRHRRRDFECAATPCGCMCSSCPCQGPNKCPQHADGYPCLGHGAAKKPKSKHKRKHHQQLLRAQDPEFLAELEDTIGLLGEVHIGRRGRVRPGAAVGGEAGAKADGGRRHHPAASSHPAPRSSVFRINLNGFYSPHPSAYSPSPSYGSPPFYPCQPPPPALHCGRSAGRRQQCGCPSKFQEAGEDLSFYRGYPSAAVPLYPHLHSSYPLPPPHQYVPHQPHHHGPHFLLNPARFHRRMGRAMRDGGLGVAGGEGDAGRVCGAGGGAGGGGAPRAGAGFSSTLGCGCPRAEHKHKRKHRHQRCPPSEEEEEEEAEEEEEEEEEVAGARGAPGLTGHRPPLPGGYVTRPADGGRKTSRDSPWLCKNARETFSSSSSSAAAAPTPSLGGLALPSLPRLSSERFRQTPLSSVGLGSSHLSLFGGSWGGLTQPWTKTHAAAAVRPGSGLSGPAWSAAAGGKRAARSEGSEPEEDDDDDDDDEEEEEEEEEFRDSRLYGAPRSPAHINLFTSAAAMETGGRKGLRIGKEGPGAGEMSWRRGDPAWRERRGAGLQGDPRRRGQQKGVPATALAAAADGTEVRKRGPGRPRKYPLPVPAAPSMLPSLSPPPPPPPPPPLSSSSAAALLQCAEQPPVARSRLDAFGERLAAASAGGDGQLAAGAKRKRGRKRKNAESPCRQSLSDDKPESDEPAEYFDQSEAEQLSPHASAVQWESRADSFPSKTFLSSGLYSDDHKTTDSPPECSPTSGASVEHTSAGERGYSLLPPPLHVGKYLRLKRIDFQLPYDVLWLWKHNQLNRQPAVPLKRKRHYCRLKGRTRASHHEREDRSGDIAGLFPHLEMEPMTGSERSFVVKQRVFLVRNWELVRDKQIRLRMERERRRQRAESAAAAAAQQHQRPCSGGDHGNIQSDEKLGSAERVFSRDPHSRAPTDTSSSLTACPHLTKPQNRREETGEEDKTQEDEDEDDQVCRRALRTKRLNNLLLALQHS